MLWKIFWAAFGFIYVIDVFICCDTVRWALWKRNKREGKWVEQHLGWESLQRNLFLIERNLWEGKLPIWAAHHDISLAQREKNVCKNISTWAACSSAIPSLISAWEETLIILATWRQKTRKQMKDKIAFCKSWPGHLNQGALRPRHYDVDVGLLTLICRFKLQINFII